MEGNLPRVVILGSGKVATHLAKAFDKVANVVQVWSRNPLNASLLASRLTNTRCCESPELIVKNADFYIIAVSDSAIPDVVKLVSDVSGIVMHTSGSVPLAAIMALRNNLPSGVFYPLQSFSLSSEPQIDEIPFFIEGDCPQTADKIRRLAKPLSPKVFDADSELRAHLHVAAVFANNFANSLWDIADSYLKENTDFDIRIFQPLLKETLTKAMALGPHNAQTGPAVRNDQDTINSHISKLKPELAEIYTVLSQYIIRNHQPQSDEQNRLRFDKN